MHCGQFVCRSIDFFRITLKHAILNQHFSFPRFKSSNLLFLLKGKEMEWLNIFCHFFHTIKIPLNYSAEAYNNRKRRSMAWCREINVIESSESNVVCKDR